MLQRTLNAPCRKPLALTCAAQEPRLLRQKISQALDSPKSRTNPLLSLGDLPIQLEELPRDGVPIRVEPVAARQCRRSRRARARGQGLGAQGGGPCPGHALHVLCRSGAREAGRAPRAAARHDVLAEVARPALPGVRPRHRHGQAHRLDEHVLQHCVALPLLGRPVLLCIVQDAAHHGILDERLAEVRCHLWMIDQDALKVCPGDHEQVEEGQHKGKVRLPKSLVVEEHVLPEDVAGRHQMAAVEAEPPANDDQFWPVREGLVRRMQGRLHVLREIDKEWSPVGKRP
mmetsp:Transcript_99383/g.290085  ORF Transcript_99383/g.290085 Transcript_99383/m.290085 type:complete len:287 (-) Transcript_99383:1681-2541(-)